MSFNNKAEETIDKLVNVFGFPRDRSQQAVEATGDKGDVQLAYNWLLDHGEEDRGGPVETKICWHADSPFSNLIDPQSITDKIFEKEQCAEGCSSEELWMCLSCGAVRCSRYVKGHNLAHFKETLASEESELTVADASTGKVALGHFSAISLRDLSVWCYLCSSYVTNPHLDHRRRLIESVKFGKSSDVEVDSVENTGKHQEMKKGDKMMGIPWQSIHGFRGNPHWDNPIVATVCSAQARPGYRSMLAHEYVDDPETLREKVALLASWIRKAQAAVVYSGAGISTAAGIRDYAYAAADSVAAAEIEGHGTRRVNPMKANPTLSHCVITQLHFSGLIHHWIQQNHDGLPQKAGFPQHHLNEIHGAWFDVSNPVVPMSGTLRDDLIAWLIEWERKTDLCIAAGTSLCGMNADRVVVSAGQRAKRGVGFGSVIISLQQTQLDSLASLRIFAKSDDVFRLLASELSIPTSPWMVDYGILPSDDIFVGLPYDASGRKIPHDSAGTPMSGTMMLDLRVGQTVRVVNQPKWDMKRFGNTALVVGKTSDGDYMLNFGTTHDRILGRWWLVHALKGEVPFIPVTNN